MKRLLLALCLFYPAVGQASSIGKGHISKAHTNKGHIGGKTAITPLAPEDPLYLPGGTPTLDFDFATQKNLTDKVSGKTSLVNFSRSAAQSPGTYVGADGLIKTAAVNLALYSEQFDNAAWVKSGATVAANQILAPDGKQTADELNEGTSPSTVHNVRINPGFNPANQTLTFSVYAKASTATALRLNIQTSAVNYSHASFNLATGASSPAATGNHSSASASIIDVGNGWFRCALTTTIGTDTSFGAYGAQIRIESPYLTHVYTGTNKSLYIWGAQLEETDPATMAPTAYIHTTSQALAAPRFDHDPVTGESLGLLVEEQRTNLVLDSENFHASSWTALSTTRDSDVSVSPKGSFTADRFTTTVANNVFVTGNRIYGSSSSSGTRSVYAKADSSSEIIIRLNSTNSSRVIFDLSAGTLDSSLAGPTLLSASITDVGNGWYRCSVSDSASDFLMVAVHNEIGSVLLWGAQLEAGAFPTSYIPTTGSSQTRYADIAAVQDEDFSTTNLLAYSESFDVGWANIRSLDTANVATAPDGTATADYIEQSPSFTLQGGVQTTASSVPSTGTYTQSVYAKAGEKNFLIMGSTSIGAWFDLQNGQVGTVLTGNASIESAGNGWYRCSWMTTFSAGNQPVFYLADTDGSATVVASGGIYLWGASLTATEYPVTYTTTRNLLTDSQDFERSGSWITTNATIGNDAAQAPDGTNTADEIIISGDARVQGLASGLATSPHIFSVYLKSATGSNVNTRLTSWRNSPFQGTGTQNIVVTTEWQRFELTMTPLDASFHSFVIGGSGTLTVGEDIYAWGAQLEPGTATDYVRTVDVVGKRYGWYEPTEGAFLMSYNPNFIDATARKYLLYSNDAGLNRFSIRSSDTAVSYPIVAIGTGTSVLSLTSSPVTAKTDQLFSVAYGATQSVAQNGTVTSTSSTQSQVIPNNFIYILSSSGTLVQTGHIKRLTYWPVRQSDSTLQVITQ